MSHDLYKTFLFQHDFKVFDNVLIKKERFADYSKWLCVYYEIRTQIVSDVT